MKLLIVESEPETAGLLHAGRGRQTFTVDHVADATAARDAVEVSPYDAIVLDLALPREDAFTLAHQWRQDGLTTPILYLTARAGVEDCVRRLLAAGDDFLVKPFDEVELLARIAALVHRPTGRIAPLAIELGELCIDVSRRVVNRGGRIVHLSTREYQLLEYMARNAGRPVSRNELWEHVWGSAEAPDSNVVDVYVRYLRNRLGRRPDLIKTVRGLGYLLEESDLISNESAA